MERFEIGEKIVTVYPCSKAEKPIIYLNIFEEGNTEIYNILCGKDLDLTLVTIGNLNWIRDLSPWKIPPISKNEPPFAGGADEYLTLLTERIIPTVEESVKKVSWRGIAGYSLAGLFAVYSLYRTDLFTGAASVSGSLWFPKFKEFVLENEMKSRPDSLYFSLGNKEHKTRNPYMQTVRENTEQIEKYCRENGVRTCFEVNEGNHFQNEDLRTANGIAWILKE